MQNQTKTGAAFLCLFALTVIGSSAEANLVFSLMPATQTGTQGGEVLFSGTLSNTGTSDLFLNGIEVNLNGNASSLFVVDYDVFLNNVPVSLDAAGGLHSSYNGLLFGLKVDNAAPLAAYTGSATFTGGVDGFATNSLASQNFQVVVQANPVPEPGSMALAGVFCLCGAGLALRRRRK